MLLQIVSALSYTNAANSDLKSWAMPEINSFAFQISCNEKGIHFLWKWERKLKRTEDGSRELSERRHERDLPVRLRWCDLLVLWMPDLTGCFTVKSSTFINVHTEQLHLVKMSIKKPKFLFGFCIHRSLDSGVVTVILAKILLQPELFNTTTKWTTAERDILILGCLLPHCSDSRSANWAISNCHQWRH